MDAIEDYLALPYRLLFSFACAGWIAPTQKKKESGLTTPDYMNLL